MCLMRSHLSRHLSSHHLPSRLSTLLVHPPHLHFPQGQHLPFRPSRDLPLTTATISSPTLSYILLHALTHTVRFFTFALQHSLRSTYQIVSSGNQALSYLKQTPQNMPARSPVKPFPSHPVCHQPMKRKIYFGEIQRLYLLRIYVRYGVYSLQLGLIRSLRETCLGC